MNEYHGRGSSVEGEGAVAGGTPATAASLAGRIDRALDRLIVILEFVAPNQETLGLAVLVFALTVLCNGGTLWGIDWTTPPDTATPPCMELPVCP